MCADYRYTPRACLVREVTTAQYCTQGAVIGCRGLSGEVIHCRGSRRGWRCSTSDGVCYDRDGRAQIKLSWVLEEGATRTASWAHRAGVC